MSDAEKKTKKPAKKPEHPPFSEMVVTALKALKDRTGSSRQAIEKYIKANYKVGDNCGPHLKLALKRMSEKGTLVHSKGKGASGSFKLNKEAKVEKKKKPAKKPAAKKPAAKKVKSTPKKAAKKTPTKKSKSPKKKADKPKKAKKPAAAKPKAAKKPAAKKPAKKAAKKPAKKAVKSPKKK